MIASSFVIETARLRLVAATVESARAELEGPAALAGLLGVVVPSEWPPELYDADAVTYTLRHLEAEPASATWASYYFVLRGDAADTLIGVGGYKGPPRPDGTVEIGYAVLPPYQRKGYGAEAAAGLTYRAFEDPRVTRVIAETLPDLEASQRVLRGNGFECIGDGSEPGVIRFERRR